MFSRISLRLNQPPEIKPNSFELEEPLKYTFQQLEGKKLDHIQTKELAGKILELSSHPLKKQLYEWINFDAENVRTSKVVKLAKRFLLSNPKNIEQFAKEPAFEKLCGKKKCDAAYLLLADEELLQHKNKILEFFTAANENAEGVDINWWSNKIYYRPDLKVPLSKILQWHQRIVTSDFSPKQSLALFNKLCRFVENGEKEISEQLFTFLLSFKSVTRLEIAEILVVKEELEDLVEKCALLLPRNITPKIAFEVISYLKTLSKEKRQDGFLEVVALAARCKPGEKYLQVLTKIYDLPSSERRALVPHFQKISKEKLEGERMLNFLELLPCFTEEEGLVCLTKVKKLLPKGAICHLQDAFKRILLQKQEFPPLKTVVERMLEFVDDFHSDLNRALLVYICSRETWVAALRALLPAIKEVSKATQDKDLEARKALLLLSVFLTEGKRETCFRLFKEAKRGELDFKIALDFLLAIPEKDKKPSFLSICWDVLACFLKEGELPNIKKDLQWLPPDKYQALFDFYILSQHSIPLEMFADFYLRSKFADGIVAHLQRLLQGPMLPEDRRVLNAWIIDNRRGLNIPIEHPLMQKVFESARGLEKEKYQVYQNMLKSRSLPLKADLKRVNIHNKPCIWNLSVLQGNFSAPYTFADLTFSISLEAFEGIFKKDNCPWYGPLGTKSPYPTLLALEGNLDEKIPTEKFYLHSLLRHFDEEEVQEMMKEYLFNLWSPPYKHKEKSRECLEAPILGFYHALGYCYYKLPVYKRVYSPNEDAKFILRCFKTSLQKVFYETFVEIKKQIRAGEREDSFITTLQNVLSGHVGFPHPPIYPEGSIDFWYDPSPTLQDSDGTEDQLVSKFFSIATPDKVVKEIIEDSRTLILNGYLPALRDVLASQDAISCYLDETGEALNEEGALKILEELRVIQKAPTVNLRNSGAIGEAIFS